MSSLDNGNKVCDRCGVDVKDGSLLNAVVVAAINDDGQVVTFHLCYKGTPDGDGCASRVLTAKALKDYTSRVTDGEPVAFREVSDVSG